MEMTIEYLLNLIEELDPNVDYEYIRSGKNKAVLISVDHTNKKVEIRRKNTSNGSEKSASMTTDKLRTIVDNTRENVAFSMESIFSGGGNTRSVWEAILANTREYYYCMIDNKKHLIWLPNSPHDIGKITEYRDECNNRSQTDVEHIKTSGTKASQSSPNLPFQRIYYGAPGTGKSNEIKRLTGDGTFSKDFTFRTTFHPDSDYASFVGAYKPIWDGNLQKIVYNFRPQTFLKAYIEAWRNPDENVALVIEEINRGNCAQIFGDIFQLLDRENTGDECGLSKYPIEADIDMQGFLYSSFHNDSNDTIDNKISDEDKKTINNYYGAHYDNAFDKIAKGEILTLPKNLSILATMNTSDQSLFPMDSAFKRRWEWIYQAIIEGIDKEGNKLDWKINLDGYDPIDWWKFLQRINKVIADLTTSEDKQLGYFFCMPDGDDEKTISAERFVGKVIFYLWNDVFKDYAFEPDCCKDKDSHEVLYAQFYEKDGKTPKTKVLEHFFNSLKDLNGKPDNLAIPEEKKDTETEEKPADE